MKHPTLLLAAALALSIGSPAFAQHGHSGGSPAGNPGGGRGNSSMAESHGNASSTHSDMSHAAPNDVLSHNTVIAGKIKSLTGQDANTACNGFKNLGQCVAAAHVAKNLDIPGGFDALKAKMTGSGAMSLGKAIGQLAPQADAKAEAKKANKQASDDLKDTDA
ncbi:MAG: hypothetical protein WBL63_24485 [Candidatus Acidiferrum sp.]